MKRILTIYTLLLAVACDANFSDKINSSGIDFENFNGMIGEFYFHEMMGGGVALFDYDNDGDLDVYFTQGNIIAGAPLEKLLIKPSKEMVFQDRLYRNDSIGSVIKFTDVTDESGISAKGYGMGVSVGDMDNDGDWDIYLSNFGDNQFWMNNGDGTFSDMTQKAGVNDKRWSITSTFVDYNNDGYLDLYVVNYVDYEITNPLRCKTYDGKLDYCSPQGFEASGDSLFKNNGDGTFTNVSSASGVAQTREPGLGVVSADFNVDGYQDLYVANDGRPNILWINNKRGGFTDKAMMSGVAVNMSGMPEASMGVDAADFDNDGDIDLFMTHLNRQTNTLYVNNGKGWFNDASVRMGLASTSFRSTGFGTLWGDFNNDGYLDLFSANGAVIKEPEQAKAGSVFPLRQSNQLWLNDGTGKYKDVSKQQDSSFLRPSVSRGAAFGDIDNDGDLDIVVSNNAGKPMLLINDYPKSNWVGFRLLQNKRGRDDIGARVELQLNDKKMMRHLKIDGSYASSHDSRVLFGLGEKADNPIIKVIWSNGKVEKIESYKLNSYNTIIRDK